MVPEGLKEIAIDAMIENDLPEVLEIERASFTMPWSEISFFNQIKNPRCISKVARVEGRIAGYICASRLIDEGHILTFAVHPEHRKLGIASALITEMLDHLKDEGCRFIFLEVRASNEAARRMYEKFGFREIGTRKNYYVSPVEDAVLMVLKSLAQDT
jgi:[ribosomal protein S18]-alanine N-acetyltransferase